MVEVFARLHTANWCLRQHVLENIVPGSLHYLLCQPAHGQKLSTVNM